MTEPMEHRPPAPRIILASASPRRSELLGNTGLTFEVIPSSAEEIHDPAMPPGALCEENARLKASAVATENPKAWVIGADTLVFLDGHPLGKPIDLREASTMLAALSGRTHIVRTGVCVIDPAGHTHTFHEVSHVTFHQLDEGAIRQYHALVNPLDKAGAYGIQEHRERIIASIDGQVDNVMGLPVPQLMAVLESKPS